MTWVPLLLADSSPSLRALIIRDLLNRPEDDSEFIELVNLRETDSLVSSLVKMQANDGSWKGSDLNGSTPGGKLQATAQALTRLGYLGLDAHHPTVKQGAEFIFSRQKKDGSWPLAPKWQADAIRKDLTMVPLQTAIPLRGLATCGYSADPRAEKAYDWLINQRLKDGSWPTGLAGNVYGYVAGYRKIAHSRWGCRTNTTASLICLALHPERRKGDAARRALDLLLSRETREKQNVGFTVARIIGVEPPRGYLTYFAKYDLALILDMCWRVGASKDDERVDDLVKFIQSMRGPYGLWEYPARPEVSRWVTFDILRSLSCIDSSTDWISMEPRTPFRPYPKTRRRF